MASKIFGSTNPQKHTHRYKPKILPESGNSCQSCGTFISALLYLYWSCSVSKDAGLHMKKKKRKSCCINPPVILKSDNTFYPLGSI